jgi:hypothetical protein
MQNQNSNANSTVSVQSVNLPDDVLLWAVEHHTDFDFEYLATQMDADEIKLYKQSVLEDTIEFFQSLMD